MQNKENSLISGLLKINTKPAHRVAFTNQLIENNALLLEVVTIAKKNEDKISGKAARAMELVGVQNITLVLPYIQDIFIISKKNKRDDVIRPMAKIIELLVIKHFDKKKEISLSTYQKEEIINICFDWMITPQKIAPQAHSMLALYFLGYEFDWVHPELKLILEQNYAQGSAGYKARSRKILNSLKKQK